MPRFYYGGQAVMEGVMMRGRQSVAVAIRPPVGDIYVYEEALNSKLYRSKLFRLPFFTRHIGPVGNAGVRNAYNDALCKYRFWGDAS